MSSSGIKNHSYSSLSNLKKHSDLSKKREIMLPLEDSTTPQKSFHSLLHEEDHRPLVENALSGSSTYSISENLEPGNLKISEHAKKRMIERNIHLSSDDFLKLKEAISLLKKKGGQDSLIVTSKAAYIIDVDQEKIVTAFDTEMMQENIITKIDSTLFLN
jgi:flagellar operon protein